VEGQTFKEQVALALGRLLELFEVDPGSLGVDVLWGDGGDAAPQSLMPESM
jgi:hypothetical protein